MRAPMTLRRLQKRSVPYALLFPATVALVMFSLYPFLSGIWYSLTNIGWVTDEAKLIGFANYRQILIGNIGAAQFFHLASVRSLYWTVTVVGGQFLLGLLTALVLNERFPGRLLFRTAVLVPIAMPGVILVLTWAWMYDPFYGLINHYLQLVGLLSGPKAWVGQTNSSVWPMILVGIWMGFPFMSLMLLSGLQGIPQELYDAAKVDGAGAWASFWHITVPQMRTIITISLILHVLWWWNHFDILKILGSDQFAYGAMTLPILAWYQAFRWSHLAQGAAISVMSMLFLAGVMIWNARRELRSVNE